MAVAHGATARRPLARRWRKALDVYEAALLPPPPTVACERCAVHPLEVSSDDAAPAASQRSQPSSLATASDADAAASSATTPPQPYTETLPPPPDKSRPVGAGLAVPEGSSQLDELPSLPPSAAAADDEHLAFHSDIGLSPSRRAASVRAHSRTAFITR